VNVDEMNELRLRRSAIRQALAAGEMTAEECLGEGCCGSMMLVRLLEAQRGWGSREAERLVRRCGVGPYRLVRELTARQRSAVSAALDERRAA